MADKVLILNQPQRTIYGVWGESSDKSIPKDIPNLSKKYYELVGKEPESVLPFYVLSKDYDPESGCFQLFIGGEIPGDQLESFSLPEGDYGQIAVKPKLGFLWGPAIGAAKGFFYGKWLPACPYTALNMEYEYHSEKSLGKGGEIDLYFAIQNTEA